MINTLKEILRASLNSKVEEASYRRPYDRNSQSGNDHGLILRNIGTKEKRIYMIAKFITDLGLWPQDEELRHMVTDFKIKVAVTKNLRLSEQNMIESRNPHGINIIQAFINRAADEINMIMQDEDDQ